MGFGLGVNVNPEGVLRRAVFPFLIFRSGGAPNLHSSDQIFQRRTAGGSESASRAGCRKIAPGRDNEVAPRAGDAKSH